jgi:hypothetical protein
MRDERGDRAVGRPDASSDEVALAAREEAAPRETIPIGSRGIELRSIEELYRFAKFVAASPFAPRGFQSPEAIVVAIQYGYELGLTPMQSLQNVAVINGKPSIYGDAMLAVVRASGLLEYIAERLEGAGATRKAVCLVKRVGAPYERVTEFGVIDAQRAGLWGKPGPWQQYPDRMLMFRARGFALRDEFGDVLKGLVSVEEAADYPPRARGNGSQVFPPSVPSGSVVEPPPAAVPEGPITTEQAKEFNRSWAAAGLGDDRWDEFAALYGVDQLGDLPASLLPNALAWIEAHVTGERATAFQVEMLETLIEESGADRERVLEYCGVASLEELPAVRVDELVAKLQRRGGNRTSRG